jgi:hypothetical protein
MKKGILKIHGHKNIKIEFEQIFESYRPTKEKILTDENFIWKPFIFRALSPINDILFTKKFIVNFKCFNNKDEILYWTLSNCSIKKIFDNIYSLTFETLKFE